MSVCFDNSDNITAKLSQQVDLAAKKTNTKVHDQLQMYLM